MAFKGFAKGGNSSTYNVLPIGTEVNEDLRIANEKVQDIQLTAQSKAGHAQEYISALNHKFQVEHENRENNNTWFKNNHKRIWEGEQREYKAEIEELTRQAQVEAQKASQPSTLQKALPHILNLVTAGAGMIEKSAAAGKQALAEEVITASDASNIDIAGQIGHAATLTGDASRQAYIGLAGSDSGRAMGWNGIPLGQEGSNITDIANKMTKAGQLSGQYKMMLDTNSLSKANNETAFQMSQLINGRELAPENYPGNAEKWSTDITARYNKIRNELLGNGNELAGQKRYMEMGFPTRHELGIRGKNKFLNSVRAREGPVFGKLDEQEYARNILFNTDAAIAGRHQGDNNLGAASNVVNLAGQIAKNDFSNAKNPIPEAWDSLLSVNETNPNFGLDLALEVRQEVLNRHQPGKPYLNEREKNRVMRRLDAFVDLKQKAQHDNTIKHNKIKAQKEEQFVTEVFAQEPAARKATIQAMIDSGDIYAMGDRTQAKLLSEFAGQDVTKVTGQANETVRSAGTESNRTSTTKDVVDKHLQVLNPDKKKFVVGDATYSEIRNDADRIYAEYAKEYPEEFKANPIPLYEKAVNQALKENELTVTGKGVIGTVGLTSKGSNDIGMTPYENLVRDVDLQTGEGIKDILEVTPDFNRYLVNTGAKIQKLQANPNKKELTNADMVPYINHPRIVAAWEIGRQTDRFLTKGQVLETFLKEATGKDPGIRSGITTRQEMIDAYNLGINYTPNSYIGQQLTKYPGSFGPSQSFGLTNMSSSGGSSPNPGGVGAYNTGGTGNYGPYAPGRYPGRLNLTRADAEAMAVTIAGEAGTLPGRGFAGDDAMVAGVIINRMTDDRYPGTTAHEIVSRPGQFIGWHPGETADPRIVNWLLSQEGQSVILDALHQLEGRTSFKGLKEIHNKGVDDPQAHPRANYAHFKEQRGRNDPTLESYKRDSWKKLWMRMADIRGGGGFI